jgi:hypothetical protein
MRPSSRRIGGFGDRVVRWCWAGFGGAEIGVVFPKVGVDQRRFGPEGSPGVGAVGCEGVAGAAHADGAAPSHLVAHGVRQRLGRVGSGDLIAVLVDADVQVAEVVLTVGAQDGPAEVT